MNRFIFTIFMLLYISNIADAQDFTKLGGSMTSSFLSPAAIQVFAPNVISGEHRELQLSGFAPFHKTHTEEEGLGPRFINSSCGGCHFQNGRGPVDFNRTPIFSGGALVVKVKYLKNDSGPKIGPVLQNHSITGKDYHDLNLSWTKIEGKYPDGTKYFLRKPDLRFSLNDTSYRKFASSLRMSPPIIGVGLIEAIDASAILAKADSQDLDGDGVSGRPNIVTNIRNSNMELGRFGYKAGQPSVEQQSAAALGNEMGMSNTLFPVSRKQTIEFSDDDLYRVTVYQKLAGVPAARDQSNTQVQLGKKLFFDSGCESCHTSTFTTGGSDFPELTGQTIHPFSDFLLHDMGPGLADKHTESSARGSEWKTTPLWGIGFSKYLSKVKPHYLHDGRARTLEDAIIWHEGEAKDSRDRFMNLDKQDRDALIAFLLSI